ncbi:MAG: bifunctional nuclease family protein [Bacteroidota bacterium]|nr:bifunctional nuclease family protein [Bacteroidota bacterium]
MNKILCEIMGLSSGASAGGAFAIVLKESEGRRRLPIMIGNVEAHAIAAELEGMKPQRPLTHDLMKSLLDNLGAIVLEIIIDDLRESTFYAKIILELSGLTYDVDARPSDAIALAVRAQVPIYVAESVLDIAAFLPSDDIYDDEDEIVDEENPEEKQKEKEREPIPKTKADLIASLQNKLREALEAEEYERAAKLRDDIKKLTSANN